MARSRQGYRHRLEYGDLTLLRFNCEAIWRAGSDHSRLSYPHLASVHPFPLTLAAQHA
jgi:hypothetical protein